jgi:hypothetical protein
MAITHTRTIEKLRVLNDDNNIVCRVKVKWTSSDDSDVERTTIESSKAFKIETEGVTSDSDGFISFESLTQETVEEWIATELAEQTVTTKHESKINSILNHTSPLSLSKTTPW